MTCEYCFDAYDDHTDCLTFLEKIQETIVDVINVTEQVKAERAARARDRMIARFLRGRR